MIVHLLIKIFWCAKNKKNSRQWREFLYSWIKGVYRIPYRLFLNDDKLTSPVLCMLLFCTVTTTVYLRLALTITLA